MLYLVSFDEQRYTRRMESFQPERLEYIVEFDASLSGAGILWFKRLSDGTEVSLGGSAVDLRGFILRFRIQPSTSPVSWGWLDSHSLE